MSAHDRYAEDARYHDDRYDEARDADEAPPRRRRGFFRRVFALVKFAAFALPLALFVYGRFADCSARPSSAGWLGLVGAGACARNEMIGSALSMQDNFALLKRLID